MDFKALHEELKEASKFLYESNEYKLTIITGRDRDSDGELTKESFKAKNDLEALLYVFKTYDLQNAGMFNGTYEDGDWDEEDEQLRQNILNCVKENKIEEGIKLLTDLYFDGFDISDYYDDIVKLEAPDGHIVFEDDIDIEGWYGDEDEIEYEEEEFEGSPNQETLEIMLDDALAATTDKIFLTNIHNESTDSQRMDIVPLNNHIPDEKTKLGWIQTHVRNGYTAVDFNDSKDRVIDGTIQDLQDWIKRHYSK